jgi:hypothetical protein
VTSKGRNSAAFLAILVAATAAVASGAVPEGDAAPARSSSAPVEAAAAGRTVDEPSGTRPTGVTRIQGRALEGRRTPVVGASVAVRDQDGSGVLYLTSTDARGYVRAMDLPDGTYTVTFRKPGYGVVIKSDVEVRSPLRPVLEVKMEAGARSADPVVAAAAGDPVRFEGRAVDAAGRPVPDVVLRLVRSDGRLDPRGARTAPDGGFAIPDLAVGRWDAEIRGVGFLPVRTPVDADRSLDVTLRLIPQPADYEATALDLMPPETPIAPPALPPADEAGASSGEDPS